MYIWKISNFLLFDEIRTKIFVKYYKEVILTVSIFSLLFNEARKHSWALMSPHECFSVHISARWHSWAFMSMVLWHHQSLGMLMRAHDPIAPRSWLLLSSYECSLLHGAKLMSVHGCSWVLMAVHECSWLVLAAYECIWVITCAHECSWLYMSTHE